MPRTRKRKRPISQTSDSANAVSSKPQASRAVIRRFHVLLKAQTQLRSKLTLNTAQAEELVRIHDEIEELGGLEWYQQMSAIGQGNDRGGGSERVFIEWLREEKVHKVGRGDKFRLLEVGALKPDNYQACASWVQNTPIDLRSRHPLIKEQDFLLLSPVENRNKWNAISLSLVVNFVPEAKDRGHMLHLAQMLLTDKGYLFLVLPLPCVANSRYMTFKHLTSLMNTLGFAELKCRWRAGGKMAYWLYQKQREPELASLEKFTKKVVLRQGHRNNFAILLNDMNTT